MKLGVNGLGRIGKLSLWNHVTKKYFDELVINLGRDVGSGLTDLAASIEKDSTYGRLSTYVNGFKGGRVIEELDEAKGTMRINGMPVVDSTGQFKDPTADPGEGRGSCRGHLLAGAEKVIVSAPFKIKAKGVDMPEDAITTVMGINDDDFDPARHTIISAASCTTTCLSYMIKPLLNHFGAERLLSASMVTVHAATGTQEVLDRLPGTGATDLRKNRSILNNIILTSTGAAKALSLVIPEMKSIGFIAESVRVPTTAGSLIVLVLNLQDELDNPIKRGLINEIYEEYSKTSPYLIYSAEQNVSSDIMGMPKAAVVIESTEIHTRTATIRVNLDQLKNVKIEGSSSSILEVPLTQAVIYGWYDNELGSYTNMLGELTKTIADQMV